MVNSHYETFPAVSMMVPLCASTTICRTPSRARCHHYHVRSGYGLDKTVKDHRSSTVAMPLPVSAMLSMTAT